MAHGPIGTALAMEWLRRLAKIRANILTVLYSYYLAHKISKLLKFLGDKITTTFWIFTENGAVVTNSYKTLLCLRPYR